MWLGCVALSVWVYWVCINLRSCDLVFDNTKMLYKFCFKLSEYAKLGDLYV